MKYQLKTKIETLRRVLRECIKKGEFTSSDIVKSLNLSKPTVNDCLERLYADKFLVRETLQEGRVGRKAQIWKISLHNKKTLAMDIDVDLIKLAVVDMNGDIYYYREYKESVDNNIFAETIKYIIEKYKKEIPTKELIHIKKLGISLAGNVSFDRKNIIYATNLALSNINIAVLEQEIGLDIILENEANCAVLGEFFISREYERSNFLLVSISNRGVGGGQIVEGKLQKGAHRLGGEIGHFTIVIDGEMCTCGNKGCFERYASYEALKKIMLKHKANFNTIDEFFKDTSKSSEEAVMEYSKFLGRGIRGLLSIYDSAKIILSGKISIYWDRIYPHIHREIFENNYFYSDFNVILKNARYKDNASLVGVGLINFFEYVYEENVYK